MLSRCELLKRRAVNAIPRSKQPMCRAHNTLSRGQQAIRHVLNMIPRSKQPMCRAHNTLSRGKQAMRHVLNTLSRSNQAMCRAHNTLSRGKQAIRHVLNMIPRSKQPMCRAHNTLSRVKNQMQRALSKVACKLFGIYMDFLRDEEVVFTDSFAPKPVRTFLVNTNAPLHSVNSNILPSSGVCTFPSDCLFPDRFILWRAIGQKLYLEERSLCRTVVQNTLCLDFSRTPILPGTSIALFEPGILCIVVPTQSTVHRFFAKLLLDPIEMTPKEVPSILTQINEKEFLVEDHTSYQLTTNGHAFRASVIQRPDLTRISYCMAEGQMVVVTMHADKYDKIDEAIFREYGLMKRLLGEASGGICDVYGLSKVRSTYETEDLFYAIYRDGTLRAWNSETQRVRSVDVCKFDDGVVYNDDNLRSLAVKAYHIELLAVVVVAISTTKDTKFHFVSDRHNKLNYLFTVVAENAETLLDFGILQKNDCSCSLWALWNAMSTANEYIVKYMDIDMLPKSVGTWRTVNPYSIHDAVSSAMTVSALKDYIFTMDSHPFDIVFRSVQIVCQGSRCECAYGDWSSLATHVDAYTRSSEFDTNYIHRGRGATRSLSSDAREEAEKRFFYSLCCTCDQLERAARAPLGLFLLDVVGASLAGVVQQDRFSIVVKGESKLIDEVDPEFVGVLDDIVSVAVTRAAAKEDDALGIDEYEITKGPAHDCTAMRAQPVVKKWSSVMDSFLETVSAPFIAQDSPSSDEFGGSFTYGLIASMLRHVVRQRLDIARKFLSVIQLYAEDKNSYDYPILDFPDLEAKFTAIINLYKLCDDQLSLKLPKNGVQTSLYSWVMSEECVDEICKAAGVGHPDDDAILPQFSCFRSQCDTVVNVALQVLSPHSPHALLARLLATHEKYSTLMSLCTSYADDMPKELRPVITFYSAIAYSGIGKPRKAMSAFNAATRGVVQSNNGMLFALSPVGHPLQEITLGDYYVAALSYLHKHRHSEEVIEMARSAISSLPPGHECTSRIYLILFNHLVNQGNWCDALLSIIQNTDMEMKRTTLRELISRMIHAQDWKSIVELKYRKLEEDVENILLTAARSQEATATPHLFKLVFSFT
ncbi:hypothetical protein KIN20_031193 [Parelaphostrongylus tenuis]|uniref:Uncharacterized protein n=1 Tax=Parelaphostrongylus tenuis TaxID=148309 RepID=A0AAD5R568_PARTN|nr:hypothetical protein KIN20_031193 [Parelaphostrongylus tenuis]